MTSLIVSTVLQASLLAAPGQDYTTSAQRSLESGRPLVVLLGAPWCPACKVMQNTTLPQVAQAGGLRGVEFAYVDVDQEPRLTAQLARGRSIPQLICFEKQDGRWSSRHLIGGATPQKVNTFLTGEPEAKPPTQKATPASWTTWTRLWPRK